MKEVPNGVSEREDVAGWNEAIAKGQDERALCLRVLAAVLGEQAAEARVEQALALAQEIYELELEDASVEEYH